MNSLCMSAAWVAFWRNKVEILNLYNKQSCPPNFKKRTHSGLKGVFGQEMIAYCMNAILFVRFQNQNNYIYIYICTWEIKAYRLQQADPKSAYCTPYL